MTVKLRDFGLTYEQAAHGVQSAIAHDIALGRRAAEPKHLRTGLDLRASDALGLAVLLIAKGVITEEEYIEHMRLAANEELARRQDEHGGVTFR